MAISLQNSGPKGPTETEAAATGPCSFISRVNRDPKRALLYRQFDTWPTHWLLQSRKLKTNHPVSVSKLSAHSMDIRRHNLRLSNAAFATPTMLLHTNAKSCWLRTMTKPKTVHCHCHEISGVPQELQQPMQLNKKQTAAVDARRARRWCKQSLLSLPSLTRSLAGVCSGMFEP